MSDKAEVKSKKTRRISGGVVHISARFNNTIITITDMHGDVLASRSTGYKGMFSGARKSTPHAAQVIATDLARFVQDMFMIKTVSIRIKGPGAGRESAIRAISASGLIVTAIKDITSLPHNGCRPPKKRRV